MKTQMTNPTILAIETATSGCSAALLHDGHVEELYEVGNNIHSKKLLSMISELFAQASIVARDLDFVAVGQGPGSFTGLRIGVGVGQGIAYGSGCRMIGVSSLDALAQSLMESASSLNDPLTVLAAIDARMGEVYWAEYCLKKDALERIGDWQVSPPEAVSSNSYSVNNSCSVNSKNTVKLVGNAWPEYWEQFNNSIRDAGHIVEGTLYPSARHILQLAIKEEHANNSVPAADFAPIYVRNDVAKKSTKPLPGRRVQ